MKTSTKRNSSKLMRTLGGLIFYPKKTGPNIIISMKAWIEAGKPDNVYIFDHLDTLRVCGIPVCDGLQVQGLYQRVPWFKPRLVEVTLAPGLIEPLKEAEVKTQYPGIKITEVKEHHRMSY